MGQFLARARVVTVAALFGALALPQTGIAADFYAGKTITFSTHTAPGGEYDGYLRQMARFVARYIPGAPNIIVLNQPGAGGLLAVNYAAKLAPQDGTFVTLVSNGLLLFQALGQPGLEVSLGDFKWIGNFSAANAVTVAMDTSGVRTIQEAMQKPVIIGSTGAGSTSYLMPVIQNALIGTRFKVVPGYDGTSMMVLAMRRGEIQGRSGAPWHDYLGEFAEEIKTGKMVALSQIGLVSDPALPNAPMLIDLVKDDPRKLAAARFVSASITQTRSLAAPPGVPDDRIAILRAAYDQLVKDPEFIAALDQSHLVFNPVAGVDVQREVRGVLNTPKEVIEDLKSRIDLNPK